jgi:hypothetical protein
MVFALDPSYTLMEKKIPIIERCGSYTGGFVERWGWDKWKLEKEYTEDLLGLYLMLKADD